MAYNQKSIVFYPNLLKEHQSLRERLLNFNPENEPTLTGETYTCSGGETSGALYDLVDDSIETVVTIDTFPQTTNPVINFDTSTEIEIDTVIIAGHNLDSSDAEIEIKYNTSTTADINNSYSGSQGLNGGFECSADSLDSEVSDVGSDGVTLFSIDDGENSTVTDDNFVIDITYGSSSYDDDIEIGEISFCKSWTAPHAPEVESWQDTLEYGTELVNSTGGKNYGIGYYGERKRWNLSWTGMSNAKKTSLEQVFRTTKGSRHPLWVDLGENASAPYLYYVRFAGNPVFTPIAGGTLWNVSISIRQEI